MGKNYSGKNYENFRRPNRVKCCPLVYGDTTRLDRDRCFGLITPVLSKVIILVRRGTI